jgi:hypothetical protein
MAVPAMPFDVEAFGADLLLLIGKTRTFRRWVLSTSPFWTAKGKSPGAGRLQDALRASSKHFSSFLACDRYIQGCASIVRGTP